MPSDDLAAVLVHRGAQGRPFVRRLPGRHGNRLVRAVVRHELVGGQPQLLDAPELQGLDPEPLLGAGQFVAVHGVRQFGQFAGQGVVAGADRGQFAVHLLPAFLGAVALLPGQVHGHVDEADDLLHGGGDGGGASGLEPAAAGPFGGFLAGAAFGGGGAFQRRRPVAGGRELFLGAAQGSRASISALRASEAARARASRCSGEGSSSAGASWAAASRAATAVERFLLADDVGLGPGQGRGQPFAFADGAAQHGVQVAQAFGDGREPGVGVVEPFQGGVGAVLRLGPPGLRGGEGEAVAVPARR